jgi:hypothetical protein
VKKKIRKQQEKSIQESQSQSQLKRQLVSIALAQQVQQALTNDELRSQAP